MRGTAVCQSFQHTGTGTAATRLHQQLKCLRLVLFEKVRNLLTERPFLALAGMHIRLGLGGEALR